MKAYTTMLATQFHGFRIDNCHSTPIHVAQYFLDVARQVRPNLYVVAELFTGSEERDLSFVSKLGINSLIREAMNAWDPAEFSRLIHRYGGQPVGSISLIPDYLPFEMVGHQSIDVTSPIFLHYSGPDINWYENDDFVLVNQELKVDHHHSVSYKNNDHRRGHPHAQSKPKPNYSINNNDPHVFVHNGSRPHGIFFLIKALFMDCTHDNETPFQKRTAEDALSTMALVCMTECAVGSVKGFDELVPKHIDIVNESRLYQNGMHGIAQAKLIMQKIHFLMGQMGYTEIHVHQENEFITVLRQNPFTHRGFFLVARTGFKESDSFSVSPFILRNTSFKCVLSSRIKVSKEYLPNDKRINGLDCALEISHSNFLNDFVTINSGCDDKGFYFKIIPKEFTIGSILLLETDLLPKSYKALQHFKDLMNLTSHGSWYLDGIVRNDVPDLKECFSNLTLQEMNIVLYRCNSEEQDVTNNGSYVVPGFGELPFCGLQGLASVMRHIAINNDLGHPLCEHLRNGFWLFDYIYQRLDRYTEYSSLNVLRNWLEKRLLLIRKLPNYLVPKYLSIMILTAYHEAHNHCVSKMSSFVKSGSRFVRLLALGSIQLTGVVASTSLNPFSRTSSLAAGLPHFRFFFKFITALSICVVGVEIFLYH
jgi:glycogen debranching enzyme